MTLLQLLDKKLSGPQFKRVDPATVRISLGQLTDFESSLLVEFFERFRGPIGSNVTGFQLLDAVDDNPNVVSATEFSRHHFGLGKGFVVISDVLANGALIYDARQDKVFTVDFEGGVELLNGGMLKPSHDSLEAFFREFFDL